MKPTFFTIFATMLSVVSALPVEQVAELDVRQTRANADDLKDGKCAGNVFVFARGSTEIGNMGTICGPQTCSALKLRLSGDVICQGVGDRDGYAADLASNFLPKNTNSVAINGAVKLINQAASQCPGSNILLAGYSQGSAVMDNAIQALSANVKSQVKGVVMFGFTRNAQDNGGVPGFPADRTKVFCATGDLVCFNTLTITPAHLTYGVNAPEAASFLAGAAGQ
ncbi:cutinase 1 [Apiospora kogelbergensis]|uniref:cutinase 1 n=1 Tax=Apiospora kogelbergensis TaxID=1337665 RepID=UPI00312E5E38